MNEDASSNRKKVADFLAQTIATGDLLRSLRRSHQRWQHVLDFDEYQGLVLERVWVRAEQFRGTEAAEFLAWLRVIGGTVALDQWRRQARQGRLLGRAAEHISPPQPSFTQQVETQDLVEWLLAGLCDQERQVIRWRYYEGKSPQEVADLLGTSVGAFHQAHHRAIEKLRARLTQQQKSS